MLAYNMVTTNAYSNAFFQKGIINFFKSQTKHPVLHEIFKHKFYFTLYLDWAIVLKVKGVRASGKTAQEGLWSV